MPVSHSTKHELQHPSVAAFTVAVAGVPNPHDPKFRSLDEDIQTQSRTHRASQEISRMLVDRKTYIEAARPLGQFVYVNDLPREVSVAAREEAEHIVRHSLDLISIQGQLVTIWLEKYDEYYEKCKRWLADFTPFLPCNAEVITRTDFTYRGEDEEQKKQLLAMGIIQTLNRVDMLIYRKKSEEKEGKARMAFQATTPIIYLNLSSRDDRMFTESLTQNIWQNYLNPEKKMVQKVEKCRLEARLSNISAYHIDYPEGYSIHFGDPEAVSDEEEEADSDDE